MKLRPDPREAPPAQLWHDPRYRWLYGATFCWNLARWIESLAVGWLAYQLTGSAWDVALIGFFRNVPLLAFGLFGGVFADRADRRGILIASQVVNVVVTAAVLALVLGHRLDYRLFAIANVLVGGTWATDWPARRSLLPDLVARHSILRAFALDNVNQNVSRVGGPLLAGVALTAFGAAGCYVVLLIAYVAALVTLLPLDAPRSSQTVAREPLLRHVGAGVAAARASQPVLGVVIITVFMNLLPFPYQQELPVFAAQVLRLNADGLGVLSAANGLGSFVCAMAMIWFGQQARVQGWLFIAGATTLSLAITLFAASHWFVPCVLLLLVSGVGQSAFGSLQSTIVVNSVRPELRGRVMGVLVLAIGSSPIGALLIGAMAQAWGVAPAIGICAGAGLVLVIVTAVAVPGLRDATRGGSAGISVSVPQRAMESRAR